MTGTPTEPERFICPDDHKHDENGTCYIVHKCRCDDCRRGRAEYEFWRARMTAAGKVLLIDTTGTARRLHALSAVGWSQRMIGERYGVAPSTVGWWSKMTNTTPRVANLVRRIYDDLAMMQPPQETKYQKQAVSKAKRAARLNGWPPPLAWDDDTIDDPTAEPADDWKPKARPVDSFFERLDQSIVDAALRGEQPRMSPPERREVVTRLHRARWTAKRMADLLGCSVKTIERDRGFLKLAPFELHEMLDAA